MDLRHPEEILSLKGGQGNQRQEAQALKSPCNKVCVLDLQSGLCKGCLRTLDEIARWGGMSDAERENIMAVLPSRRSDVPEIPVPPLS